MVKSVIWILPILCLLVSIVYCSTRLWIMYGSYLHDFFYQTFEDVGLWKVGIGRGIRLVKYFHCYIITGIVSGLISIIISVVSEKRILEQIVIFIENINISEIASFFSPVILAMVTVFESLLMYGLDFSKMNHEKSEFQKFISKYFYGAIFPALIWFFTGSTIYKDFPLSAAHEWVSSPRRVFQLSFGIVSIGIFGFSLFNSIRDLQEG